MKNVVVVQISSAHGVKGFVKLNSFTKNPADFVNYSGKIFDNKNRFYKFKIVNQIPGKKNSTFVAQIEGVNDRNQAELLRGVELFVKRSDLKNIPKDEFYYIDLVGLDVLNTDREKIGQVLSVNDFGAGGLLEIKFISDHSYKNSGMENFAFTNQFFPEVDIDGGFVVLDLPEIIEIKNGK